MNYLIIQGYCFEYVCDILPETDDKGSIVEFYPNEQYDKKDISKLNKFGNGPFCRFKIPKDWAGKQGVYAILVEEHVKYIGECEDLYSRYNLGYGNISPRNCYVRGQSTNCKINHNILREVKSGKEVKLFFHKTSNRFEIEDLLIRALNQLWNSKSGSKRRKEQNSLNNQTLSASAKTIPTEGKRCKTSLSYGLLSDYLLTLEGEEQKLTFNQLEEIINGKLPNSAYNYKAWWANGGHSHAEYWLKTGWKVGDLSLGQYVVFNKVKL